MHFRLNEKNQTQYMHHVIDPFTHTADLLISLQPALTQHLPLMIACTVLCNVALILNTGKERQSVFFIRELSELISFSLE